jgi:hypothetical protein
MSEGASCAYQLWIINLGLIKFSVKPASVSIAKFGAVLCTSVHGMLSNVEEEEGLHGVHRQLLSNVSPIRYGGHKKAIGLIV